MALSDHRSSHPAPEAIRALVSDVRVAGMLSGKRGVVCVHMGSEGKLIEVAAAETGKTIDQADPEVSEAIDFCRHYAELSLQLEDPTFMCSSRFEPVEVTVVASPWNFPLAIPAGGVAAALFFMLQTDHFQNIINFFFYNSRLYMLYFQTKPNILRNC